MQAPLSATLIDERERFERADDDIEKANDGNCGEREVVEEVDGELVLRPVHHTVAHHGQTEGHHRHDYLQRRRRKGSFFAFLR